MHVRIFCAVIGAVFSLTFSPIATSEPAVKVIGLKATELIRPGSAIPENADTSRGDVPRDDYGRPWTYTFLGRAIPPFQGDLINGEAYSSDSLAGRWTVIQVWGLWCHDSMHDAPYAAALAHALAEDPLVDFMSIHTPPSAHKTDIMFGKHGSIAAYFEDIGADFPTVIDHDASIREALHINWTPTYVLVAPDRSVQAFRTGLADDDGEPVKDFVREISQIRGDWSDSPATIDE